MVLHVSLTSDAVLCCLLGNMPLVANGSRALLQRSEPNLYKPGGTVQKSTVYLGSEYLVLSFLTSLNHQLFKNIAYVGCFGHFVICCICVFVNLYLCICVSDSPEYHF